MEPVQFGEEEVLAAHNRTTASRGLIGWLIRQGIVKTQAQANLALLLVAVGAILLTFIILTTFGGDRREVLPDKRMSEWMQNGSVGSPPSLNP